MSLDGGMVLGGRSREMESEQVLGGGVGEKHRDQFYQFIHACAELLGESLGIETRGSGAR